MVCRAQISFVRGNEIRLERRVSESVVRHYGHAVDYAGACHRAALRADPLDLCPSSHSIIQTRHSYCFSS
jgi:hypothetical protein